MVFLGIGISLQNHDMIGIEALVNAVPDKVKRVFNALSYAVQIIFIALSVYYGFLLVGEVAHQSSPLLPIKMSVVYAAIPIGLAIGLINLIEIIIRDFTGTLEIVKNELSGKDMI